MVGWDGAGLAAAGPAGNGCLLRALALQALKAPPHDKES